jgi:hypothetical protein
MVAKQLPANGEWKAFYVGGLSLLPVECETMHGLLPSSELSPVAAADKTAIHYAGADLLRSDYLGEGDVVFFSLGTAPSSSRSAFTEVTNRGQETQAPASSSSVKQTLSLNKERKSEQQATKGSQQRNVPSTNKRSKASAVEFSNLQVRAAAPQMAVHSPSSVHEPPLPEVCSPEEVGPTRKRTLSFAEI